MKPPKEVEAAKSPAEKFPTRYFGLKRSAEEGGGGAEPEPPDQKTKGPAGMKSS
jgi:hypothetical protein